MASAGSRVRKAVIPAAGLGTRFLPLTKAQPKEMLPIVDKPMIQYVVEEAVAAGIEEVILVTGPKKRAIQDHFARDESLAAHLREKNRHHVLDELDSLLSAVSIRYVLQERPEGLGHAILCARQAVDGEPFAVMLGDDVFVSEVPVIRQIMDVFASTQHSVMSVQHVDRSQVGRYGILDSEPVGPGLHRMKRIVEKPEPKDAPSSLAAFGRYVFTPELFDCLQRTQPGKNDEIQLSDGVNLLLDEQPVFGAEFQGRRFDAGDKFGLLVANIEFALNRDDFREPLQAFLSQLRLDAPRAEPRARRGRI